MEVADLQKEVNRLKRELAGNELKYYHFKSIQNFLFHFKDLNKYDQGLVRAYLIECINYYKDNSIGDVYTSLEVFQKFLKPTGKIYERALGFFIFIKPWILFLYIISGYVFVYFLFGNNPISMIILFSFSLGFVIYLILKFSQKKMYAFLW